MHKPLCILAAWAALLAAPCAHAADAAPADALSLTSISAGAWMVKLPRAYEEAWAAYQVFDERPETGWSSAEGETANQVFVLELAEKAQLDRLVFDTGHADEASRSAKDIRVEVSDKGPDSGYAVLAEISLKPKADNQSFALKNAVAGRWLRLTIRSNHGAADVTELMDFRAYGTPLTKTPSPAIAGTYGTNYNDFHLLQQGPALSGCYELNEGVMTGGLEGRIMKITWREHDQKGTAALVVSPDAKEFFGFWWNEGQEKQAAGIWQGKRKSSKVGGCPHWAGGAQQQLARDLAKYGRIVVYGINFDTGLASLKDESRPVLDGIVTLLKENPAQKLTIEGHTDTVGSTAKNKPLSQARAEAVKAYLVKAGIADARLKTLGLGSDKPVASNDTPIGRAQNRRVEFVKQ